MATDELAKLAAGIGRQAAADGTYDTAIPALRLSRFTASSDLTALVYEPCLCVVAQGTKEVVQAGETYHLDPAHSLLVSVDLPVAARVVEASPDRYREQAKARVLDGPCRAQIALANGRLFARGSKRLVCWSMTR